MGVLDTSVEVEYQGKNIAFVYVAFRSVQDFQTLVNEICKPGSYLQYFRPVPEIGYLVYKFQLTEEKVKNLYDFPSPDPLYELFGGYQVVDRGLIAKGEIYNQFQNWLELVLDETVIDLEPIPEIEQPAT